MPSHSPAQHRFMEAVDHNRAFAKRVGVPRAVGHEFVEADEAKGMKAEFKRKESHVDSRIPMKGYGR